MRDVKAVRGVRMTTFGEWLASVDRVLVGRCGMTRDDLPDWSYRDAYDSGVTARQAAQRALKAAKDF